MCIFLSCTDSKFALADKGGYRPWPPSFHSAVRLSISRWREVSDQMLMNMVICHVVGQDGFQRVSAFAG